MKKLVAIYFFLAMITNGYGQTVETVKLLDQEILEKVRVMMDEDEGLLNIESFYQQISKEKKVDAFIASFYSNGSPNNGLKPQQPKIARLHVPAELAEAMSGILPDQGLIDSIPDPFFDPAIKRFNYKKEHESFFYAYNDLKEAVNQKAIELDAVSAYVPGGTVGKKTVETLDRKFGFSLLELSAYRQDMVTSSKNAQHAIAKWSLKSDLYAGTLAERRTSAAREASAYRISRAILMRMCAELEFRSNLSLFKARKIALGNMAAQAALLQQNKSITKGSAGAFETMDISKGLFSKIKLMLFDAEVLQQQALTINYGFNTLIEMSRLE